MVARMKRMHRAYPYWHGFSLLLILLLGMGLSGCGVTPYSSKFSCPPGYNGMCESVMEAYQDSVDGIDPRQFDPKWQKARKKWEEKHADLLEARRKAREAKENVKGEAPDYRESLFTELKALIQAPETPVLVPPRVVRGLVLGLAEKEVFVSPHYVFFQLDEPRWVLKKFPERMVPAKKLNATKKASPGTGQKEVE